MSILLLNEWGFKGVGTELYTNIVYQELRRQGVNVIKASIRGFDYDVKLETSKSFFRKLYDLRL